MENPKYKPSNDERARRRSSFFAEWMSKLAAAYRQEISLETQAMYLDGLSDLPLDRLNDALKMAVKQCRFFPTIAEIRALERDVERKSVDSRHVLTIGARVGDKPDGWDAVEPGETQKLLAEAKERHAELHQALTQVEKVKAFPVAGDVNEFERRRQSQLAVFRRKNGIA